MFFNNSYGGLRDTEEQSSLSNYLGQILTETTVVSEASHLAISEEHLRTVV